MESLLKPLCGSDLLKYISTKFYKELLFPEKVSTTLEMALNKITGRFNVFPTEDGENNDAILLIRKYLFKLSCGYPLVNSFVITAPHTHWAKDKPVTYKYDALQSRYIIGIHDIDKSQVYTPVSFVFSSSGLLAYEWCDTSIKINKNEIQQATEVLKNLNRKVHKFKYPFGVSIDFRFKQSLFDNLLSTVELPADENDDYFSVIYLKENQPPVPKNAPFDQVGWHPVSDICLKFDNDELQLLNDVRTYVNSGGDIKNLL